jgi:tellurite resistance protein TerC
VFAVDSVPAVLGVSSEPFVVVTSNIFAVLGLRSLFFVLAGMMHKFRYLQIALALLLMAIGAKLLLHSVVHIPNWISLAAVVGIIGSGILFSLIAEKRAEPSIERRGG